MSRLQLMTEPIPVLAPSPLHTGTSSLILSILTGSGMERKAQFQAHSRYSINVSRYVKTNGREGEREDRHPQLFLQVWLTEETPGSANKLGDGSLRQQCSGVVSTGLPHEEEAGDSPTPEQKEPSSLKSVSSPW